MRFVDLLGVEVENQIQLPCDNCQRRYSDVETDITLVHPLQSRVIGNQDLDIYVDIQVYISDSVSRTAESVKVIPFDVKRLLVVECIDYRTHLSDKFLMLIIVFLLDFVEALVDFRESVLNIL